MESDSEDENLNPVIHVCKQRLFKDRINFDEEDFTEKIRLTYQQCEDILHSIGFKIKSSTNRNHPLSTKEKLLLTSRFLSTGSFYHVTGDCNGLSKATVCRVIKEVVTALNETFFDDVVKWLGGRDATEVATSLFSFAGLPRVDGCIDGTLIKLKCPRENEERFVDRHGSHSRINQFPCFLLFLIR